MSPTIAPTPQRLDRLIVLRDVRAAGMSSNQLRKPGDAACILDVPLHAQSDRRDALQKEKCVERPRVQAERALIHAPASIRGFALRDDNPSR